jgi:hypothetical protein
MVAMQLVPPTVLRSQILLERMGFRFGERGTQSSRTIMLEELRALLAAVPGPVERDEYQRVVLEGNCLGKRTTATRKLSFQRLSELYGLNPTIPLFRILRDLWPINPKSQPLLALLLALARDPLLRITASPVHKTPIGNEFTRQAMIQALDGETSGRFNPSTLDKIARNASSSWTQSGHLQGRVRKLRQKATPTPVSCAYALLLAHVQRARGQALFESPWVRLLDLESSAARDLADDARRLGLLDLKQSGTIIELAFPQFLTSKDLESMNGSH